MKIPVNLKILDIDIDDNIKKQLTVMGLPDCLGCMFPPIVEYEPEVEITDLFVEPASVDSYNIMEVNTTRVVPPEHADKVRNTVISKQSYEEINKQMVLKANIYVERVAKCAEPCKYIDICYKLTTNYLKLVEISLNN